MNIETINQRINKGFYEENHKNFRLDVLNYLLDTYNLRENVQVADLVYNRACEEVYVEEDDGLLIVEVRDKKYYEVISTLDGYAKFAEATLKAYHGEHLKW